MEKQAGRILKANDVKIQGSYHLDIAPKSTKPGRSPNVINTGEMPQVRVVEENPDFAILEVTCGCGSKAQIKCEFKNNGIN